MVSKACKVCEEAQSKYKCPTCLIPYCSLTCFKKHKEIPCVKPEASPAVEKLSMDLSYLSEPFSNSTHSAPGPVIYSDKPYYVDDPSEVLQSSQLESIVSSSEIRNAVKNEELQKLICQVACAEDAEKELDKTMEVEAFHIFTDKILSTLHPQSE